MQTPGTVSPGKEPQATQLMDAAEGLRPITLSDIREAAARIQGVVVRTPVVPLVDEERTLYLKPENLQPIGAFKLRGAYNKIASLSAEERQRGVITYSSGNHAQGVAYAARALSVKAVIVMPGNAPEVKRQATAELGAEIVLVGPSGVERQLKAEELAGRHGYVIVPPYDDPKIIAGQGTVGLEILEDVPDIEVVLVPVGGGGLISGISTAIKSIKTSVQVIGVEPALAADAQASLGAGRIVKFPVDQVLSTCADGLRAQYVGTLTFEHIRRYVDSILTVSEDEILSAVRVLARNSRTLAEPSGAVATAAWLYHGSALPAANRVVAVISGGNIDPRLLAEVRH